MLRGRNVAETKNTDKNKYKNWKKLKKSLSMFCKKVENEKKINDLEELDKVRRK